MNPQSGGIGYAGAAQFDAHEVAQCLRVIDRVFDCFIGQAVPLLYEVHAKLTSLGTVKFILALRCAVFIHNA